MTPKAKLLAGFTYKPPHTIERLELPLPEPPKRSRNKTRIGKGTTARGQRVRRGRVQMRVI